MDLLFAMTSISYSSELFGFGFSKDGEADHVINPRRRAYAGGEGSEPTYTHGHINTELRSEDHLHRELR